MAEQPQEDKKTTAAKLGFRKNLIKRFLRGIGLPVHYTKQPGYKIDEMPTYKQLDDELNYNIIYNLNDEMIKAEADWDGAKGTRSENENASKTRNEMWELFEKLCFYTDLTALQREINYTQDGTRNYKNETLKIKISGTEEPLESVFSVPGNRTITHADFDSIKGRSYDVVFFGTRAGKEHYFGNLENTGLITQQVLEIIQRARERLLQRYPENRNDIIVYTDAVRQMILGGLARLKTYYNDFEEQHRAYLTGFLNLHSKKGPLLGDVNKWVLQRGKVVYGHTYRVIRPKIIDEMGNPKVLPPFPQTPKEIEAGVLPGYDENGWPLEVTWPRKPGQAEADDSEYIYEDEDGVEHRYGKGYVLIDIFNGNTTNPRRVDQKFTMDCDLLDMASWVYVNFDAYRDDLRDGRYHSGGECITIMEKIMKDLKHPFLSSRDISNINNGVNARVTMNLNHPQPGKIVRPPYVNMTVRPSHLNPAFDLRVKEKSRHLGRKYYYDTQDHMEISPKRTITTRGAAMNILAKVVEDAKYFDEMLELLDAIGDKTYGFDIGPNINLDERWGKKLTRNPFKPSKSPQ